jgi:hypothetical protein
MFLGNPSFLARFPLTLLGAFAPAGSLAAQFPGPSAPYVSQSPLALAFGNMTAGGNPDLVAADSLPGFLLDYFTWRTNGGGSCPGYIAPLPTLPPPPVDQGALDIAVADVDSPLAGLEEVVTLEPTAFATSYQIRVWAGVAPCPPPNLFPIPTGTFGIPVIQMRVADFDGDGDNFDGDGDNDVITLDDAGNLWVHTNAPAGLSAATLILPPGGAGPGPAVRFAVGSFNGDHLPDLVVLWGGVGLIPAQAHVLVNTSTPGAISFAPAVVRTFVIGTNWVSGPGCASITTGDFNGDGCDDFVVGGGILGGGSTLWYCNVNRAAAGWPGVLTLPPPVALPNALGALKPVAITSGDWDLDGDLDLAYTATDNRLHIRPGLNNGTFPNVGSTAETVVPLSVGGVDIEACDIDGDGDLDLGSCDGVATYVYCNNTNTGRCRHVLRAGIDDAFFPFVPPVETTCPRVALGVVPRMFDSGPIGGPGAPLGHTFANLPGRIVSAKLYLHLREQLPAANLLKNDRVRLDFGTPGLLDWAFVTPVRNPNLGGSTMCLDLADLPSALNLLPRLASGRLDVRVDMKEEVDFMRLELVTACPDHNIVLQHAPAGVNTYYHNALISAGIVTFSVDAGATHANGFAVVLIGSVIGGFPFESLCLLDLPIILTFGLDAVGKGSTSVGLSILPPCLHVHSQALAFTAVPSWLTAKWSTTISDYTH